MTLLRIKFPAYNNPEKCWNFERLTGVTLAFLQMNLLRDYHMWKKTNIETSYQELRDRVLFAAKQSFPRGRCKNYLPYWAKE